MQAPEWYREADVGAALRNSSTERSAIFLTSKLHPRHHGYESALQQLDKVLSPICSALQPLVTACLWLVVLLL